MKYTSIFAPLIFCSLLIIAVSPAGAAASKSVDATVQYVQQAINDALSPVQTNVKGLTTRVKNLEATVTPIPGEIAALYATQASQSSQINNFQNGTSKALRIFDANDHELGIMIDVDTVYNTNLNKIIPISANGLVGERIQAWYTTNDCSGTAYTNQSSFDQSQYIFNIGGVHMEVDTTIPVIETLTIHSIESTDFNLTPNHYCTDISHQQVPLQEHNVLTLKQVASPYQEPIPLPLRIKYQ